MLNSKVISVSSQYFYSVKDLNISRAKLVDRLNIYLKLHAIVDFFEKFLSTLVELLISRLLLCKQTLDLNATTQNKQIGSDDTFRDRQFVSIS